MVRLFRGELGSNGALASIGIGRETLKSICAGDLVQTRTLEKLLEWVGKPETVKVKAELDDRLARRAKWEEEQGKR